jgi:hypothetical protein
MMLTLGYGNVRNWKAIVYIFSTTGKEQLAVKNT